MGSSGSKGAGKALRVRVAPLPRDEGDGQESQDSSGAHVTVKVPGSASVDTLQSSGTLVVYTSLEARLHTVTLDWIVCRRGKRSSKEKAHIRSPTIGRSCRKKIAQQHHGQCGYGRPHGLQLQSAADVAL